MIEYDDSWKEVPCQLSWKGMIGLTGYSRISFRGSNIGAHRVAWIKANGEIPDGYEVCHKCYVKNCVEPLHLYLDTHQGNVQDAGRLGKMPGHNKYTNMTRTHCNKGHELTPKNTTSDGRCKSCRQQYQRESYRKRKGQ